MLPKPTGQKVIYISNNVIGLEREEKWVLNEKTQDLDKDDEAIPASGSGFTDGTIPPSGSDFFNNQPFSLNSNLLGFLNQNEIILATDTDDSNLNESQLPSMDSTLVSFIEGEL